MDSKLFSHKKVAMIVGIEDSIRYRTKLQAMKKLYKKAKNNPFVDTDPTYGQAGSVKQSSGQFWINTGSGDIWVYVD